MNKREKLAGISVNQYIALALKNVFYKIISGETGSKLEVVYGRSEKSSGLECLTHARAIYRGKKGSIVKLQITGPFHMECPPDQNFLNVDIGHIVSCRPM